MWWPNVVKWSLHYNWVPALNGSNSPLSQLSFFSETLLSSPLSSLLSTLLTSPVPLLLLSLSLHLSSLSTFVVHSCGHFSSQPSFTDYFLAYFIHHTYADIIQSVAYGDILHSEFHWISFYMLVFVYTCTPSYPLTPVIISSQWKCHFEVTRSQSGYRGALIEGTEANTKINKPKHQERGWHATLPHSRKCDSFFLCEVLTSCNLHIMSHREKKWPSVLSQWIYFFDWT